MTFSGWRLALVVIAALVLIGLLLTAIFWVAIVLAVLLAVAWFNVLLLPRIAGRLHVPQLLLAVVLLALLAAGGFGLGGALGAAEGAGIWLLGVAAPRLVLLRVRKKLEQRNQREPMTIVLPYRP